MSYSSIQDWVDGFSRLENFSRVSIDTWYKMRPLIKSYPETISAIHPCFDDSIIDNAIITLAVETDGKKIDFAKNSIVERMKEYFSADSVSDMSVTPMTGALDNDRKQFEEIASGAATKPEVPASAPKPADIPAATETDPAPRANFSADDAEGLINYIAEKHKLDTKDVTRAIEEMSSQPYPMSRVMINNFLCNRYNFPVTNEGEVTSRISEYLNNHIDIKDSMKDKLDIAKSVVNSYFQADNFLVMDILNAFMDPEISKLELPAVLHELLLTSGVNDVPEPVINQLIVSLTDNLRRYDMEIADESVNNFSHYEIIKILNQTCKDHRLKLASNEIKWIYDSYLNNNLDEKKTAKLLQGIETESGRWLQYDTAVGVLKDFRERVRDARASDGFTTFSRPKPKKTVNFNKIVDSAFELSEIAAQAGIDDKFVFDNYNEFAEILMGSESTEQLLSNITGFLMENNYTNNSQEASLIAQDFVEVLRGSDWAKNFMPLKNFARNDLISKLFSLGYSERDIAIKLHEPLAQVRNFAGGWLDEFIDNLARDPGLSWIRPDTLRNSKEPDRYTFVLRLVQVLLAAGLTINFILPHLKELYYTVTNHQKTDAEKYAEIKQIVEENQRFRNNGDRAAQALLQMQGMFNSSASSPLGLTKSMYGGF